MDKIKKNIQMYLDSFFEYIGEDSKREGLKNSANRIFELNSFLYSGYKSAPESVLNSIFSDGACDEMVVVKNIEFYSMCEHHILPFFGKISIGYIPDKKVVGISNLAKLIEILSRRLQIQEKLTTQIADTIMKSLKPRGAMIVCEATHLCMAMRGVQKQNATIITSAVRGRFKQDTRTRMEFMQLIS